MDAREHFKPHFALSIASAATHSCAAALPLARITPRRVDAHHAREEGLWGQVFRYHMREGLWGQRDFGVRSFVTIERPDPKVSTKF